MDNFSTLNVKLKQVNGVYKATTTSFPTCKGVGSTVDIALEKLSQSISRFIGKVAKDAMRAVFLSDRYTEVVLDTSQPKEEHVRVFNLDPSVSSLSKSLFVKVKPISSMKLRSKEAQDVSSLLSPLPSMESKQMPSVVRVGDMVAAREGHQKMDDDGIVFGFYLSYN